MKTARDFLAPFFINWRDPKYIMFTLILNGLKLRGRGGFPLFQGSPNEGIPPPPEIVVVTNGIKQNERREMSLTCKDIEFYPNTLYSDRFLNEIVLIESNYAIRDSYTSMKTLNNPLQVSKMGSYLENEELLKAKNLHIKELDDTNQN